MGGEGWTRDGPREGRPPPPLSTPSSPPSSATPKLEEMEASQRAELLSSCGQKERKREKGDCYVLL